MAMNHDVDKGDTFQADRHIALVPAYDSSESSPTARARATAWTRVFTPNFEKILLTWRLTVLIERTRAWAIS